jgi:hypothetical protein
MYALDRGAVIDFAIADMVGGKDSWVRQKQNQDMRDAEKREEEFLGKLHEYQGKVKDMVLQTGIIKEEPKHDPVIELKRKNKLRYLFKT